MKEEDVMALSERSSGYYAEAVRSKWGGWYVFWRTLNGSAYGSRGNGLTESAALALATRIRSGGDVMLRYVDLALSVFGAIKPTLDDRTALADHLHLEAAKWINERFAIGQADMERSRTKAPPTPPVKAWEDIIRERDAAQAEVERLRDIIRNAAPTTSTTLQAEKCVRAMGEQFPSLLAENARLREALTPFAALAAQVDELRHEDDSTCPHRLSARDIRHARAVLHGSAPSDA